MSHLGILILAGAMFAPAQPPPGADYYAAAATAASEVDRQIDYLQRAYFTTPPIQQGRGLFKQTELLRFALYDLQNQIKQKASRDNLYLAYSGMDAKLTQLLGDLQGLMNLDPALAYAGSRLKSANHDLHFALSYGDQGADRQSQATYRQTLVLLSRTEDLTLLVRFVFDERETLAKWNADLADLKGNIVKLQAMQQDKAAREDLKNQLTQCDKSWDRIVAKVKALPPAENILLRNEIAQVDQAFARLYGLLGIAGRRATLSGSANP